MIIIKNFISIFFLLLVTNQQHKNEKELIVTYSAISCSCAQWRVENIKVDEKIYLERATENILDANSIWDGETLPLKLKVKGSFKNKVGLPKDFPLKGEPKPGRVFSYYQIEIIK